MQGILFIQKWSGIRASRNLRYVINAITVLNIMLHSTTRSVEDSHLDLVEDGRVVSITEEPPGNSCAYVPPGDPNKEIYRLGTFLHFPPTSTDQRDLARAGFYFTGFKDRVKCFSCGNCIQDWRRNDDPTSRNWHKRGCRHTQGTDESNIPIHVGNQHVRSIRQANSLSNMSVSSSRQMDSGNFVQSATVGNRPLRSPPASVVAATLAEENHHGPVSSGSYSRDAMLLLFPCLDPNNPHMRNEDARMRTFRDNISSWSVYRINASLQDIVSAGFYYLGERDRVKCWYCNGGLHNWEANDIPWREHAKWYPTCEFLLQSKGPDFVSNITASYPNLRRPVLTNHSPAVSSTISMRRNSRASTTGPQLIDPQDEVNRVNRLVQEAMESSSEQVSAARNMGFEDSLIKRAFTKQYTKYERFYVDAAELVNDLITLPPLVPASNQQQVVEAAGTSQSTNNATELQRLQEERICKICRNQEACVVLIPCGHLVCCVSCSQGIEVCPNCGFAVNDTVRSYVA